MISVPGVSAERFKLDDARRAVDALGEDDSAIVGRIWSNWWLGARLVVEF